jgi:hypothetical protein
MEYHLKLFDAFGGAKWMRKTRTGYEFTRAHPGDMIAKLRLRIQGSTALLQDIREIRRQVIRYDKGLGVPVYYIRLAEVHLSTPNAAFSSNGHQGAKRNHRSALEKCIRSTKSVRIPVLLPFLLSTINIRWVHKESGTLESEDPWGECESTQVERDNIASLAEDTSLLSWPYVLHTHHLSQPH